MDSTSVWPEESCRLRSRRYLSHEAKGQGGINTLQDRHNFSDLKKAESVFFLLIHSFKIILNFNMTLIEVKFQSSFVSSLENSGYKGIFSLPDSLQISAVIRWVVNLLFLLWSLSSATSSQNMWADVTSSPGLLDCCPFFLVTAYSIDVTLPVISQTSFKFCWWTLAGYKELAGRFESIRNECIIITMFCHAQHL